MAEQILIQEPRRHTTQKPQWSAFLSLGFRPLYIAGAFWALVSVALWVFAPQWLLNQQLFGVYWHAHEMLWGVIGTIAVGFLLTAAATWTGQNPMQGKALAILSLLWVLARIAYLWPGLTAFFIAGLAETIFFLFSAIALMRVIVRNNSQRNLGIPFLAAGLGLTNAWFLWAMLGYNHILLMHYFALGLLCMAMIALLVARRVIPFFAMRAVPGLKLPMLVRAGHLQLALTALSIMFLVAGQTRWAALPLALTGVISLYQVLRWQPLAVLSRPLLWILYLGYTALGLGLIAAALHLAGLGGPILSRLALSVHIIGMGGFGVLIIGMITRTALGHMGRPLALDGLMLTCYWLVIVATILRLAALWPTAATLGLLHGSTLLWGLAFVLYLWRFVPMLIRPRP